MATLIMILQLLPAIIKAAIESVHAVEQGFTAVYEQTGSAVASDGAHKAAVVEAGLTAAGTGIAGIPLDKVASIFAAVRDAAVAAFKALGIFKAAPKAA